MKITAKDSNGNLTIMHLGFEPGRSKIAHSFTPLTDEPICVYYFESGWQFGYPTFHVIVEYGDMEDSSYDFMTLPEICKRFCVTPEEVMKPNEIQSFLVEPHHIIDYSNDQELGAYIRKQFNHKK